MVVGLLVSGCALVGEPEPMSDSERRQYLGMPPADFIGSPIEGEALFAGNCSFCHGLQLQGTSQGPALNSQMYGPSQLADQNIYRAVRRGVKQRNWKFGEMPARAYLSPEKAGHIVAYIRQTQWQSGIR